MSLGGTEYPIALQLAPALLGGILTNIADTFTAVRILASCSRPVEFAVSCIVDALAPQLSSTLHDTQWTNNNPVSAMQAGLPGLIGVPAIQLALAQWTSCAVVPGGNSVGDPSGPWPDLCGYAQRVYQPAFALADLQACACTVTPICP